MKYSPVQNSFAAESDQEVKTLPVISPLDGSLLTKVSIASEDNVARAVAIAKAAQVEWAARTIRSRSQIFFRYRELLLQHQTELAQLIHEENGKLIPEATAEVTRAVEVTEFACSLPQLIPGQILEVSKNVECSSVRHPLGVVASITPFNFPIMVPHWTIPITICLGNALLLKPSEKVPLSAQRSHELLIEAGLPEGIFQVIQGDRTTVEAICDHPDIQAVSFVGSTPAAKAVYIRATSNLKRALCLGGAKNHLMVLPDANEAQTSANVLSSMAGCAGQRCMAAATMLAVGEVDSIIDRLCQEAQQLIPGETLGAVISAESKARIEKYIDEAEKEGAKILVDGRNCVVSNREGGFYIGPTVLDHVTPEMKIAQEEVFGPVLAIIRAKDIQQAVEIENASPFGNAAAVYTQSGGLAKKLSQLFSAGMIGVNIGVPVPLEPFGFGGWNESKFGVGDITGPSSVEFWSQSKKITSRWTSEVKQGWMGD